MELSGVCLLVPSVDRRFKLQARKRQQEKGVGCAAVLSRQLPPYRLTAICVLRHRP